MFVELHILQNFAPANLNRDDTGAPKECEFGGYRRARISSQCLKRAIRRDGNFAALMAGNGGVRTRRLVLEVAERIAGHRPAPDGMVRIVSEIFKEGGIERQKMNRRSNKEEDFTKLILFTERSAIDDMANCVQSRWAQLAGGDKAARKAAVQDLGQILATRVKAPDIALFGRMVEIDAEKPFGKLHLNVDAACQVAHAISTNRVSMEFDFYTAVEELPGGEGGAGMLGTVEFNSACFYRYANLDLAQLLANLGGHEDLARHTVEAFVQAAIDAVPTGKQNSTAAQNPPSFVLAIAREHGLWSLANAFVRPVRPDAAGDLVEKSIAALDAYWGRLAAVYGEQGVVGKWCFTLEPVALTNLQSAKVANRAALVQGLMDAISFADAKAGSL